jgi:hypothetical protein
LQLPPLDEDVMLLPDETSELDPPVLALESPPGPLLVAVTLPLPG